MYYCNVTCYRHKECARYVESLEGVDKAIYTCDGTEHFKPKGEKESEKKIDKRRKTESINETD